MSKVVSERIETNTVPKGMLVNKSFAKLVKESPTGILKTYSIVNITRCCYKDIGLTIARNNPSSPSSQGLHNITVNVKESSKNTFVIQLIIDNSSQMVDALGGALKKQLK